MRPGFTTRSLLRLALTANALRPSRGPATAIPSYAAGWLTGELAPKILGLTALDAAVNAARQRHCGSVATAGLATSPLSTARLLALAPTATDTRATVEDALITALGQQYR